ncbi:MAG TPA: transglutaminase domain-containing protein, partial [Methylomirabilota bacterium]|nr:transglutaminase domain-containing protein [Methylomirabilota bacterium]
MKTPPLLLGACLLFWGWQTGIPLVGAVMALVLEGSRAMGWRWELGDDDFGRLWKLSLSLLLGDAVYAMSVSQRTDLDLYLFPWLPIVFFPMVAGQVYSTHDRIPLRVFFWPLPSWMTPEQRIREINVTYPYFGACLLATSVSNRETLLFYAGNAVLLGWTLWTARARRFPAPAWLALFAVIIAVGYQSSGLLSRMQKVLERRYASRIAQGTGELTDPYESRTAIGRIGRLKLSGAITLRIDPFFSGRPPGLLRQTSYTLYNSGYWLATRPQFARVPSSAYSDEWELLPEPEDYDGVRISTRLGEGLRLLAVPHGAFELDRLPVKDLATNRLGTFRVFGGPDWVNYRARFHPGQSIDGPPGIEDLRIPRNEDAALQRIADDLGLHNLKPEEAIATIRAFFEEHFRYTTFLSLPRELSFDTVSPLSRFLLELREGHCEYFASATVLLLREAGIPARYVTGYAVREFSPREQRYVVRMRDAHAWTIYYADGRWHELDTTPGSWQEAESARAAWWEPVSDYLST